MTDRELLELAARSAGYGSPTWVDDMWQHVSTGEWFQWNPLTDDRDAMHLRLSLSLPLSHSEIAQGNGYVISGYVDANSVRENYSGRTKEKRAATRRAIVRAAAELGRSS